MIIASALVVAASSTAAEGKGPARKHRSPEPSASVAFFQRDWVLMTWALRFFDGDGDIALSSREAAAAGAAFRKLADVDHDGRITPTEYRLARRYILTRN